MHPNKAPFIGILTKLDAASDKVPSGARGHKVILTKKSAEESLSTLIGMGISVSDDLQKHNASSKIGIIDAAEIQGNEIVVSGYIFCRDSPDAILAIRANAEDLGMSYEIADARVEDMRTDVWSLSRITFTGAAILLRDKAAYKTTDFILVD